MHALCQLPSMPLSEVVHVIPKMLCLHIFSEVLFEADHGTWEACNGDILQASESQWQYNSNERFSVEFPSNNIVLGMQAPVWRPRRRTPQSL